MIRKDGSANQNLVDYIRKNLDKGYKLQDLKWALISQGHSKIEVDKAIKTVNEYFELQNKKKIQEEIRQAKPEVIVEEPKQEKKGFWKKIFG